jgi:hypothetical protein
VGYDPNALCLQNRIFMGDGPLRLASFSPDERPIDPAALERMVRTAGFSGFSMMLHSFRNTRLTPFGTVQRFLLEPLARGPLAPYLKRWFFWQALH